MLSKYRVVFLVFLALFVLMFVLLLILLKSEWRQTDAELVQEFGNAEEVKIEYSEYQDTKIRYLYTGDFESPKILFFIHGAPGSLDAFKNYYTRRGLRDKYGIISVDRPGYGYSDYGKSTVDIEKQALMLLEIVKNMNEKDFHLVSHSYGGPIAAVLSAMAPEQIKSHTMIAPAISPNHEKVFFFSSWPRKVWASWMFSDAFKVSCDEKMAHANALRQVEHYFSEVEVPTYLVHGSKDNIAPIGNALYAKEVFQDSILTTKILEDTGHIFVFSQIDSVIEIIEQVLLSAGH